MVLKLMLASAIGMAVRTIPARALPPRPLIAASMDEMEMVDAPIEPSWILDGKPHARLALHSRGHDDQSTTAIWDCTAGTFRWYFGWDETVMILEGAVHVTAEDGAERTLRAGDIAYFAGKTWATWRVDTYVRKIAFCRKQFPAPVTLALRLRDMMRPGGGQGGGLAA
ncbi:cupin domain-containing protein [Mycoplana sp. MJR14]|uniref:cupin domain-containing protein n=1 Tax=Mycoplana sp. MJR14 TaxID=3032583 RepID=UPI000DDB04C8|nr:cupin domain-containing protein [Mycoplana sp. MJR14]MDF1631650.1 cupin domain-containing protein [Mycoplana sp. MJR14]